jgi:hypothetical protein
VISIAILLLVIFSGISLGYAILNLNAAAIAIIVIFIVIVGILFALLVLMTALDKPRDPEDF